MATHQATVDHQASYAEAQAVMKAVHATYTIVRSALSQELDLERATLTAQSGRRQFLATKASR